LNVISNQRNLLTTILQIGIIITVSLLGSLWGITSAQAQESQQNTVYIYFFWGEGCPHCAEEEPFLEDLARRYPQLKVEDFEVWYHAANRNLFNKMAAAFNFTPSGVPVTFIGGRYWIGFTQDMGEEIEAYAVACIESGCQDAGAGIMPGHEKSSDEIIAEATQTGTLKVPLIGEVNLNTQSLALSTALIAFVDGFNPCSLWVLSILLAMTLHTGSRKKILIIGVVFLTVTSLVYALFIAGLFTIFTVVSFLGWIQVVVALIALFFAVVNIKDYFWYKEGLSFTIADDKKPGIYQNIRRVMNAGDSLWGLISATVVMSAGVSLIEFSCTAGFPVLWTNILTAHEVTPLAFVLLLALYMLIYQIDELAIFLTAVFTLKSSRLEEKHGRILKLIGGSLMLTLAVVMLINPKLMDNLGHSLIIFAVAFGLAMLILLLHRKILPSFGITIGSETVSRQHKRRQQKKRP